MRKHNLLLLSFFLLPLVGAVAATKTRILPPVVYSSAAKEPSSIEENDSMKLTFWNDTVYTVKCKVVSTEVVNTKKPEVPYKGHHILFGLGGAYTNLNYSLQQDNQRIGTVCGSAGAVIQLQYAYFFHENWGLAAGLGFSHYTSYGTLNHTKRFAGQTDSDGEAYTHIATTNDWRERQAAYMLDIPIELLCHYQIRPKMGIYAGVGLKTGLIIAADWRIKSGSVSHSGEYSKWGLTLTQIDHHDFYTEPASAFKGDDSEIAYKQDLQLPAIGVMADFGFSFKLTDQINLLVGAFANFTSNNVRSNTTTEMGWRQTDYSGEMAYRNHTFMNRYAGEINSEYVESVHPWEVGLKIGIDWRHKEKKKVKKQYTHEKICDTIVSLSQRVDTVYKPKPVAVQQIVRLMETSVIWYDLDSTTPKLQPADILDKIAAILIANPEQHIRIHGHASKEGTAVHNKKLSETRAQIIYDILLDKGVHAEQMTTHGFGVEKAYQEGEHEISLDRRVEIIPVNE